MKLYLLDDDLGIISILSMIIRDSGLGEVCGTAQNALDALEDLPALRPDVVVVDLLMPEMDGIEFVRRAKERYPGMAFVMLSHVTSKDMIARAYESGVEFFINKPVNSVEVLNVLRKVCRMVGMTRTFEQVHMLMQASPTPGRVETKAASQPGPAARGQGKAGVILRRLGVGGDPASQEIAQIAEYLADGSVREGKPSVSALCARFSDSPKSLEQRIRRTAAAGMVNLANLGIEDYSNDAFTEYAGTLYNFEQVRREMDFIRGKTAKRGKVSLKKFLYSLSDMCGD